jgi:peptidoglycan/xylan/chitin deacetylase (PgdA/CDA1 family)
MLSLPSSCAAVSLAAAAGFALSAVAPSAQFFGSTIRNTTDISSIALTFDDGPNASVTPKVLDLLERYKVSATFFLIGRYVRSLPAITKEISARGHAIGNHTDTHPALTFCSPSHIAAELDRCDSAVDEAVGAIPRWMRPPFGYRGPQLSGIVRNRGKKGIVMWSASGRDWKAEPAERVINRLRRVGGGDIVLLHDGHHSAQECDRSHTIAALEHWIPRWKDAGMRFINLHDMEKRNRQVGIQ